MKEFKVRAWNNDTKKMYYYFHLSSLGFPLKDERTEEGCYYLTQFTGLYDIDNKPIYEGDIVKFGSKILEVYYDEYWAGYRLNFHTDDKDSKINPYIQLNENKVEVIGNIFENPELLEKVK